jgi:hypothetical protein
MNTFLLTTATLVLPACSATSDESSAIASLDARLGQSADIAGSAYAYRADRQADENPPESRILLMQYAALPYDKAVDDPPRAGSARHAPGGG